MRNPKLMVHKMGTLAVAVLYLIAGMTLLTPARATGLFPQTIPLGDIPSAEIWVLGNGPISTPGLNDAKLFVDADTSLGGPQLVLQTGSEITTCDPEFEGVIALYASDTTVEGDFRVAALISGTRTDTGEPFEVGASKEEEIVSTEVLPTTQLLEVCVSPLPLVHPDPQPEPSPTPTTTPDPEPTPTPEPDPTRSLDLTADKQEVTSDERVVFSGRLAGHPDCIAQQAVTLMARRPEEGAFRPFRSGITDVDGYFRFDIVVGNARRFQALAPQSDGCEATQSQVVEINTRSAS